MKKIVWKDIKNFEGKYQVSNTGLLKSIPRKNVLREKILVQSDDGAGYLSITLALGKKGQTETIRVHRLVAIAFHKNPNNLPQVNHKDGNKKNNNDWNVEWVTSQDNCQHAKRELQNKKRGVYKHTENKNWVSRITLNGKIKHLGVFKKKNDAYICYYDFYLGYFGVPPWDSKCAN